MSFPTYWKKSILPEEEDGLWAKSRLDVDKKTRIDVNKIVFVYIRLARVICIR